MITSTAGFVLGTPTKCGTTTVELTARRHERETVTGDWEEFRLVDKDRESPRRQHRMCMPANEDGEDWGAADRWLLVRNPYTRYVSLYLYLSAARNYSAWGAREVQGDEWPGDGWIHHRPPMSFGQFLVWLAEEREALATRPLVRRRGPLSVGRAYRAPWVWADSLTESVRLLRHQPGGGAWGGLVHVESLNADLRGLARSYGVRSLVVGGLHSNRNTQVERAGAVYADMWGSILHGRRVFGGADGRVYRPNHARFEVGCGCGACRIGVMEEAFALGYSY